MCGVPVGRSVLLEESELRGDSASPPATGFQPQGAISSVKLFWLEGMAIPSEFLGSSSVTLTISA